MSVRKLEALAAVICASALVFPVAAGAQTLPAGTNVASLAQVPVSGAAHNHKTFTGHYTVNRFVSGRNGKTFAVGTLTGRLGHRHISRSNVAMPASIGTGLMTDAAHAAAACPVLHLVLGPVNLNLLGLVVTLGGGSAANQPIVLDITAMSGSGNLLGNLVCSVSGLLNGTGATPLTSSLTTGLLNLLNTLLNNPALSSL
jgi:hypothetical protein